MTPVIAPHPIAMTTMHAPFSNADSQPVIEIAVTSNDLCERYNTMMPFCGTFMASCLTVSALFRLPVSVTLNRSYI